MKLFRALILKSLCLFFLVPLYAMDKPSGPSERAADKSELYDVLFALIENGAALGEISPILDQGINLNVRMKHHTGISAIIKPEVNQLLSDKLGVAVRVGSTNIEDRAGLTPLLWAMQYKRADVVQLFLERGADPNDPGESKYTPLSWASQYELIDIATLLLRFGAHPNQEKETNDQPLYRAVKKGYLDVAKVLLEAGATPYVRVGNSPSLFHLAAQNQNLRMVQTLLPYMFLESVIYALRQGRDLLECKRRFVTVFLALSHRLPNARHLIPNILIGDPELKKDLVYTLHDAYTRGKVIKEPYGTILKRGMAELVSSKKVLNHVREDVRIARDATTSHEIKQFLSSISVKSQYNLFYPNKDRIVIQDEHAQQAAKTKATIQKKQSIIKTVLFTVAATALIGVLAFISHSKNVARQKAASL